MSVSLASFGISDNSIGQENKFVFNGRFQVFYIMNELHGFFI